MDKRINNVSDLVKKVSSTKRFKKRFAKEVQNKTIAKFLFSLRCDNKLTQKQLADKIKCSQSRISKIESSYDNEVTIKDLLDYAKALNLQLELGFRTPSAKLTDLVKYHAFKIKIYLEQLTKLAQEDEALNKRVAEFHGETVYNVVKMVLDSLSKLNISKKKLLQRKEEQIHISPPVDLKEINKMGELEKV